MRVLIVVLLFGGMGCGGSPTADSDDQLLPMDNPTSAKAELKRRQLPPGIKFSERFGALLETNDQDEVISLQATWTSGMTTSLKLTDELMLDLVKEMSKLQELELAHTAVTDAGLVHLKGLTNLQSLGIGGFGSKITDSGLVHLKGLTNLQTLNLFGCPKITDAGLVHLKGLTNLQTLGLYSIQITDAGLVHLKGLTKLRHLGLNNCWQITDAGLVYLKGLTKLEMLSLYRTKVTDTGVADLKKALPDCKILK